MATTGSSYETRYRELLEELARELTSDEVSKLAFLLRFHMKGNKVRPEKQLDSKNLLTELEELDCIGVNNLTLLAELFELIDRGDLRDKIVKLGHSQVFKHKINGFMRLLWQFGQKLDLNDLENAKYCLGWKGQKENIENVWQMFEKAFEQKLLQENNIDTITSFAERTKLRMKLQLARNQDQVACNPGITSTSGTSQEEYQYIMEPGMEEKPLQLPQQAWLENPLLQYSESKQDYIYVRRASTSGENIHVGSGREWHYPFSSGYFSPSHIRVNSSEGARAKGKHEVEDGQSLGKSCKDPVPESHDNAGCRVSQNNNIFRRTREQIVSIPINPRGNQIIKLSDEEMKQYFREDEIGKGAFGTVYRAKTIEEVKLECVIKAIKFTDEAFQKSYDREVDCGRILHPFINPIIARTESLSNASEGGISYLMFPYMENRELRHNIDRENKGDVLCPAMQESNSIIWTRSIYQIVQVLDYLHNPVRSVRGCIFHRDLTSRNIFLDENFNVRIGDFGIAVEAKLNATHATLTKTGGTEGYHPPIRNLKEYNASYDVFSVGVVILEILTGKEAKLDNGFLYEQYSKETYSSEEGLLYLKQALKQRAEKNKVAAWSLVDRRDKLAKIAIEAVTLDETKRKEINLLKRLEDMQLQGNECYQKPVKLDRCVSCCINPPANLSLKGKACANNSSPCRPFCIPCLNNNINPLVCPEHGKTRPPLGDHVYGVFVAGNNVKDVKQKNRSYSAQEVAEIFIEDVDSIVKVLTAKYPLILGADKKHLKVVKPNKPGTGEKNMKKRVKSVFANISSTIKKALTDNNLDPEKDRLPNSVFIFYFSGHCDETKGLVLGSETDKITTTRSWIKEMLHYKLGVEQVVVILDCCYADSQNFADTQGLNDGKESACRSTKARIFHLSACEKYEKISAKRQGSYFTSILRQGLRGFSRKVSGDGTVQCCNECCGPVQFCNVCEEEIKQKFSSSGSGDDVVKCENCEVRKQNIEVPCMKFHNDWSKQQFVTISSLNEFIQEHFSLSGYSCHTVANTQRNGDKIVLAYYNPDKPCISIYLTDSENVDKSGQKAYHFSMDCLKEDIDRIKQDLMEYAVEKNVDCDVLRFHQSHGEKVTASSFMVAIYPKYGKDKDKELTTLDDIYKVWMTSRDLEARVRENIKGLSAKCPVKHGTIAKSMVERYPDYKEEYLRITRDFIRIPAGKIKEAKRKILEMLTESDQTDKNFTDILNQLSATLKELPDLKEDEAEKGLEFRLYDEFSIVELE